MSESNPPQKRFALLIDGDNAQPCTIKGVMAEVTKYGVADLRRIYGDWTAPHSAGWKAVLTEHSIQPVQQFRHTGGKNATDCAMIIDAMDLLYTRRFDGFCLVSSDSDFSRLAVRLREEGLFVLGFGEEKTLTGFRSACSKFILTESLRDTTKTQVLSNTTVAVAIPAPSLKPLKGDTKLVNLLRSAVEAASDDTGWSHLGVVGLNLRKQSPDFTSSTYGYKKLGDLIIAVALFEVENRGSSNGGPYVRLRRKAGGPKV